MVEGFTSIGFVWVRLVRFFHGRLFFRVVGVGCRVFGSDFFRVPLGLVEGLSSSGFLLRRLHYLAFPWACLAWGTLGLRDFAGLTSLWFLQALLSASLL